MKIELDSTAIEPGGTVSGSVSWDRDATAIAIGLCWETRGKGDKDTEVVASTTIPVSSRYTRFSLTAPFSPFTFSGKLISVVWFVTATIDKTTTKTEIVIAPGGKEVVLATTG